MATPKQQQKTSEPSTPLSPALANRRDEKAQMVNLNNRLAVYVEKVRSLETENSRLHIQISSYESSSSSEVSNMKAIYESELNEARRLLDELSKEKAQLQLEAGSYKEKAESEKNRANGLEHDNSVLEGKLKEVSARLSHKDSQLSIVLRERDSYKDELESLKSKLADLQNELENTQRLLEAETLQRVDFENKLQSVREELLFKERLYQEEVSEVRKRHTVSLTEIDARAKGEYESKLEYVMLDLREQQAADLEQMKEDLEMQYCAKIEKLQSQLDYTRKSQLKSGESSKSYEMKVERLQSTIKTLQNQNNSFSNKLQDLEGQIETERELRITAVIAVEKQRDEIRGQLAIMEKEYTDLLEMKIKLDHEIAVYRKLLEEEEQRLNLSPSPMVEGSSSKTRTRQRRKRKRVIVHQEIESKTRRQDASSCETVEKQASSSSAGGSSMKVGMQDLLHEQEGQRQDGDNTCLIM
uniref:Nuclear lamin n=1 Tax=Phallusia mammillata TaxID=59560 RepID=A0A6F9DJ30_9ASCI|nr:nuclear lamin [Phallusia mammillata]